MLFVCSLLFVCLFFVFRCSSIISVYFRGFIQFNSTHKFNSRISFFCFTLSNFLKFFSIDTVLDQAVHKEISLGSNFNKPSLQSRLLKARSPKDKRIHVMKFADLLSKCLVLDPSKRISVKSALKHDFFTTPSS